MAVLRAAGQGADDQEALRGKDVWLAFKHEHSSCEPDEWVDPGQLLP